jgi:hypothetical protein
MTLHGKRARIGEIEGFGKRPRGYSTRMAL